MKTTIYTCTGCAHMQIEPEFCVECGDTDLMPDVEVKKKPPAGEALGVSPPVEARGLGG